jgi:DNA-binding response OmpR family regulator
MDRYSNGLEEDIHVLIVEDETIIAMDINQCLLEFGYIVDEVASTTDEAILYVQKHLPNIVLMDIKLKGSKDGTEIVELIQEKYNIPVIYLTSYTDDETIKKASLTKPYGYVVKPIDENRLNTSIIMALSRFNAEQKSLHGEVVQITDNYTYNIKSKILCYEKEKVKLTKREGEFFSYMIENVGKAVNYEKIIKNVWYSDDVPVSTLRSLVRRVRYKLKEEVIENISSIGYRISKKD